MKRILKENMIRFGTKNLNEQGNSEFDPGGHYYVPQDDEITGTDIGDTKTIKILLYYQLKITDAYLL